MDVGKFVIVEIKNIEMNISIFGLGYVGCVGAACLAKLGHKVVGVDVNENKVRLMNEGKPTIIEEGIAELCEEAHRRGLMSATTVAQEAIMQTEVSFIVVGTPSSPEGHLNLNYIYTVAERIGRALKVKFNSSTERYVHLIAIRSTVLPGTNQKVGEIIAAESGLTRGVDFDIVSNPEFLREGTSVEDYFNPPLTLIGTDSEYAEKVFRDMYKDIDAEFICTEIKVAEMMKYVNNTYHALKIVFGNEVGNICKSVDVDSHKVMEIFCKDKQLNISPYYFKPGFAYGGSCLPKDMKALKTLARDHYVDVPVIESIFQSNENQKKRAIQLIMNQGQRKVGILGLSFKAGTDDLRCSPIVDVVEALLGKGFEMRIYDKNVKISELTGTNKDFIMAKIPHLQHFVSADLDDVCRNSDVLVVTNKEKDFANLLEQYPGKIIVDLVRQWKEVDYDGKYEGISWGDINHNRKGQGQVNDTNFKQTEF